MFKCSTIYRSFVTTTLKNVIHCINFIILYDNKLPQPMQIITKYYFSILSKGKKNYRGREQFNEQTIAFQLLKIRNL